MLIYVDSVLASEFDFPSKAINSPHFPRDKERVVRVKIRMPLGQRPVRDFRLSPSNQFLAASILL